MNGVATVKRFLVTLGFILTASSNPWLRAQPISISGIADASTIILGSEFAATNLTVSGAFSGNGMIVFSLEWQGAMIRQTTAAAPYTVTFTNLAVGKYFLIASSIAVPSASVDVSFDIAAASVTPANDSLSGAAIIAGNGGAFAATNTLATREFGEPVHADNGGGKSIWWRWHAPASAVVSITTSGSTFDTVLAVYTGNSFPSLNLIGANDDTAPHTNSSQVTFNAVAGTDYLIAVDGAIQPGGSASAGAVQLRVSTAPPPALTITAPQDGRLLFVPGASIWTNVQASAVVATSSGVSGVHYWLEGSGDSREGTLVSPYQWSFTNLTVGDYWLTVSALGTDGLFATAHSGFSVVSVAPVLSIEPNARNSVGFRVAVMGVKGRSYGIESATNFDVWCRVAQWTNFSGAQKALDTNQPTDRRFYRASTP